MPTPTVSRVTTAAQRSTTLPPTERFLSDLEVETLYGVREKLCKTGACLEEAHDLENSIAACVMTLATWRLGLKACRQAVRVCPHLP